MSADNTGWYPYRSRLLALEAVAPLRARNRSERALPVGVVYGGGSIRESYSALTGNTALPVRVARYEPRRSPARGRLKRVSLTGKGSERREETRQWA
jgi:hypothetical protein